MTINLTVQNKISIYRNVLNNEYRAIALFEYKETDSMNAGILVVANFDDSLKLLNYEGTFNYMPKDTIIKDKYLEMITNLKHASSDKREYAPITCNSSILNIGIADNLSKITLCVNGARVDEPNTYDIHLCLAFNAVILNNLFPEDLKNFIEINQSINKQKLDKSIDNILKEFVSFKPIIPTIR